MLAVAGLAGCVAPPPATAPPALAAAVASQIHAALPRQRPGHGVTDYPGHAEGDVPKAYAMVLLAELQRLDGHWRADEPNLARTAGRWLLDNADTNRDGIVGWGLPVAWDANDDGSVNPPHTEYTIATAIAIDALQSWAERDEEAPQDEIKRVVAAAIAPYLDPAMASPSGLAPYSLRAADRPYDIFNPAAYLAGQIQRASLAVDDFETRARYAAAADRSMGAVLAHRRRTPDGGRWYWNYSVQQDLPNDLPHAGYMIEGIRSYIEHGGRLADQFDWPAVLAHLADFRGETDGESGSETGGVRAFPRFAARLALPARTYDIGLALHIACSEGEMERLAPWLLGALEAYRDPAPGSTRFLKYPRGHREHDGRAGRPLVINEYEAYLYRGASTCAQAAPAR
ncbi:MAG: hypothetical protein JNL85_04530, partial [Rubrivivax sp.]|nr:hypothetical protein [Rubrivivax sp.]